MKPERPLNGDEEDVFSKYARSIIACLSRAGVAKKTKTRYNRSVRRAAKNNLKKYNGEDF